MTRPRVLVTRRLPSAVLARVEAACDMDLYDGADAIARAELLARVRGVDGVVCLLTERIDDEVLAAAGPSLRVVANVAVGYDNLDVAAARARGVVVTNTPGVLTEATADLTWTLILSVMRRVTEGDRLVRAGRWAGWALDFMLGTDLRGKQLGIVGYGRIGRAVGARAAAFGMRVAYTTIGDDQGGVSLDALLSTSDVVSLHVPLTPQTRHLIDQRALARMRRRAYLINTSRGPVVDEAALAWALREGIIAGAALDVYEREPVVHEALIGLENVVLAPHLGSATIETRTAMADLAVTNLLAVLEGRPPVTPITGGP